MHSSECICFWQIHRTGQHTEILGKHWYSLQLEFFSEFYSWTYSVKVIRWIPRILSMVIFKVNSCKWSPLCLQILSRVSQTSYTVQVTWHQGVLPTETFLTKCSMREEYDTGEGGAGRWWGRRRRRKRRWLRKLYWYLSYTDSRRETKTPMESSNKWVLVHSSTGGVYFSNVKVNPDTWMCISL